MTTEGVAHQLVIQEGQTRNLANGVTVEFVCLKYGGDGVHDPPKWRRCCVDCRFGWAFRMPPSEAYVQWDDGCASHRCPESEIEYINGHGPEAVLVVTTGSKRADKRLDNQGPVGVGLDR